MNEIRKSLAKTPEILLIEDDPQIRRIVKAMLIAEDYRLHEAAAAEDGIAQAAARNPDLVLLDLGHPDKDGLDVIREIRRWSHIPCRAPPEGQERDKIRALDAGPMTVKQTVRSRRGIRAYSGQPAPRCTTGQE